MRNRTFRIALLLNANKVFDRDVIEGIGKYIQTSRCNWDVYIEDEFVIAPEKVSSWHGDGIIADFDDEDLLTKLKEKSMPIVGVGSSYEDESLYPPGPYVATDNYTVVKNAFEHLRDKGITSFAFYGLPHTNNKKWAIERENIFKQIMKEAGYRHSVYRGFETNTCTWQFGMNRLADWLQTQPKATGIIAVTDARARHLLQACDNIGLMVPSDLSIIGADNECITQHLTRISLSTVKHNSEKIGFEAAKMLHCLMEGKPPKKLRLKVPSTTVLPRQSTDYQAFRDPYVIKAMHYIRMNVKYGIKAFHVLDALKLSRSNLEARFKNELGHTIHHEIHNERLKLACSFLANTEMAMNEIYKECGYPSLQYMYSVFSKVKGKTPKQYRKEVAE